MTDRPLRVALLGAGRIAGYFHAPLLRGHPDAELVVVADADQGRAHLAEGAAFVSDWRLAIGRRDVDAVVICLPPALHAEAAILAFEAGQHAYVEKPLALSGEDAARVADAWRASGRTGRMGLNFRFHPRFAGLGEAVRGRTVLGGQSVFTSAARELPGWKASRETGGGALRELGVHHADLIPHLLGEPVVAVQAIEDERAGEGAAAFATWITASGACVQGAYALSSGTSENGLTLFTDEGHIGTRSDEATAPQMRTPTGRLARVARAKSAARGLAPRALLHAPGAEPSFGAALSEFIGAARGQDADTRGADIADGQRALALVLAAEESARTGRRVEIEAFAA